jgi:hypothetical protein
MGLMRLHFNHNLSQGTFIITHRNILVNTQSSFDLRERLVGMNPMSHSSVMSPSPPAQGLPCRLAGNDATRARYHGSPYLGANGNISLGTFSNKLASNTLSS